MGGKTNTTTQQSTYAPSAQAQQSLQSILSQAQNVASTPYNPYTGQMVAGLSPTQQSGIANTNAAVGTAQPYINTAANYANAGAAAITPDQIQSYLNPYQNSVINATMANINETNGQQQQQVLGNAALQGALGGDRVGVAQSELARQQGLASNQTLAGLQSQNYSQALAAAQADRAAQGQAAYTYGNLGGEAQNAALQGAQAQIGAGGLEQQTSQAGLSAAYQQYLTAQAFPYQQTQFLAGIGIPAAGALGGTTQGTTTAPAPNIFSQLAGLGVAGAGLFMGSPTGVASGLSSAFGGTGYAPSGATTGNYFPSNPYATGATPSYTPGYGYAPTYYRAGGRVHGYADGGVPGGASNFMDTQGFIPHVQISGGQVHQPALMQTSHTAPANPYADLIKQLGGMKGKLSGAFGDYADGGFVSAVRRIRSGLKGYDDGGPVASDFTQLTAPPYFDSRWQEVQDAAPMFNRPASVSSPLPVIDADAAGLGKPVDWTNPALQADAGFPPPASQGASLPPEITSGQSDGAPLGYADNGGSGSPFGAPMGAPSSPGVPQGAPPQTLFGSPLTDERRALIAAGLGIMGGTSPFALTNIGQGGLQGIKSLDTSRTQAEKDRQVDIEAKRLAQQAQQFAQNYGLKEQEFELGRTQAGVKALAPVKIGTGVLGQDVYGIRDPRSGQITPLDPTTGQPVIGATGSSVAAANVSGDDFLKTLPADQQAIVKKIANYQLDPRSLSIRGGHRERLLSAAAQYNPDFDAVNYPQRAAAVRAFGSGPKGDMMRSFDVGISHLNTLGGLADAMNNKDVKAVNSIANVIKEQFGVEAPSNFNTAKGIVGDEIVKAIVGSRGALGDREEAKKVLDSAKTPDQLRGVIQTYKTLMAGQLHGLKKQYEDTTNLHDFDNRLSDETRKELLGPQQAVPAAAPKIMPALVRQNGHTYQKQSDGSYKAID